MKKKKGGIKKITEKEYEEYLLSLKKQEESGKK